MKIVMIVYNGALDKEIGEITGSIDGQSYTKWVQVYGQGQSSGPHLGTHVWPKVNYVMLIGIEDEKARKLMDGIRELRQRLGKKGAKAFLLPCEEVT